MLTSIGGRCKVDRGKIWEADETQQYNTEIETKVMTHGKKEQEQEQE